MGFHKSVVVVVAAALIVTPSLAMAGWRGASLAWRSTAFAVAGQVGIFGLATDFYGYPYEQGGYGEYAEYGPWARSGSFVRGCYPARQPVWTEDGWLFRRISVCQRSVYR